jgi:uncharacterized protein (UPF0333 family)
MTDLPAPPAPQPKKKRTTELAILAVVVIGVGAGAYFLGGTNSSDSPPTTTISPAVAQMEETAALCNAEAFYSDEQIVMKITSYTAPAEAIAMDCVANRLMSPATYAQWGSTSAMSGTQRVEENGLVFTFAYNGLSEDGILTVKVDTSTP